MTKISSVPLRVVLIAILLTAIVALTGYAPRKRLEEKPAAAPEVGEVGGIVLVADRNQRPGTKVIVATFVFRSDAVTPRDVVVTYGAGAAKGSPEKDYSIRLISVDGRTLSEHTISDPRKAVVEKQGVVINPEGVYAARFRFDKSAAQVHVLDSQGNVVARSDVRPVMQEFCKRIKDDPDCRELLTPSPQ